MLMAGEGRSYLASRGEIKKAALFDRCERYRFWWRPCVGIDSWHPGREGGGIGMKIAWNNKKYGKK